MRTRLAEAWVEWALGRRKGLWVIKRDASLLFFGTSDVSVERIKAKTQLVAGSSGVVPKPPNEMETVSVPRMDACKFE
jgi:hypothetical protein